MYVLFMREAHGESGVNRLKVSDMRRGSKILVFKNCSTGPPVSSATSAPSVAEFKSLYLYSTPGGLGGPVLPTVFTASRKVECHQYRGGFVVTLTDNAQTQNRNSLFRQHLVML